ncbi:type IV secretory system conjugative DNA transfer family protein [Fuerstiella marisgermanici]|uniref:Conjugative coupling factor TraD, SXT/TOL subfamily n=1 Tax=Fuerstiella marisgermanici TaxID=1891926 RepID=A0A1P8WQM7_9PLAN|nr:type IV secretory system conjugative DNA transfer family protein [Fuerstiella marisgermanici]APZ96365.1 conjugative coupling factor TraD, SXT/TOL subfamily [Fuerstiella marisgermanici]
MTITLAPRNIRERADIVDSQLLPGGPCDLNFRHRGIVFGDGLFVFWFGRLAGAVWFLSIILWLLRLTTISPTVIVVGSLLGGVIVTVARLRPRSEWAAIRAGIRFAIVVAATGALTVAVLKRSVEWIAVTSQLMGWLFCLLILTQRIAENSVSWITAHPRVPHRLMMLGRLLWRDRFVTRIRLADVARDAEEADLLSRLRCGWGLICRSFWVVLLVLALLDPRRYDPASASLRLMAGLWGLQLLMLWANQLLYPGVLSAAIEYLRRWLFVDIPADAPPNVWRSPFGSSTVRRRYVLGNALVLAFSMTGLELCHASVIKELPPSTILVLTLRHALLIALAVGLMLLTILNLTGPVIWQYRRLFQTPDSPLLDPTWTAFDGYNDRLRYSTNAIEQSCYYKGIHPDSGFPILVDRKLLFEHQLILGATGSGKTALGLLGQIGQLIRRRDGAVIILDCKGDQDMFETARREAERVGAKFKWFTNKPLHSTYIFNPVNQAQLTRLTMPQIVGQFMMSLNMHHGADYGRAWFSMSSRMLFQEALRDIHQNSPAGRPFSFREIETVLRRIAATEKEFQAAQHLAFVISNLAQFEQLNLSPAHPANPHVIRNGIHMPDVLAQKQVIYFNLIGTLDMATVGEIARLAIYSADSAAMDLFDRTGRQPGVHLIIDEAQMVMAQNFPAIMTQGRSHGVAFTLALQTLSQLAPPGGADLRQLVLDNTVSQQYFSARDPESIRHLMKISGETGYYGASWKQFSSHVQDGIVNMAHAVYDPAREPEPVIDITQEVGPRLSAEDIADISRNPRQCIMSMGRAEGYTSYRGAFPVQVDFTMTEQEYQERAQTRWPELSRDTIELAPFWPEPNAHTVVPTTHPGLTGPVAASPDEMTEDKLAELRRRLFGKD